MHYLKSCLTCLLFLALSPFVYSQSVNPDPQYKFVTGPNVLQDRNFYLFTLLERLPDLPLLLCKDSVLKSLADTYKQRITHPVGKGENAPALLFSDAVIQQTGEALNRLLQQHPAPFARLLQEMRASGLFELHASESDAGLLTAAWKDAAEGVNYIINAYTNGSGMRYPMIDSARFYVQAPSYKTAVQRSITQIGKQRQQVDLFFQPSLALALDLLVLNRRDEAGRYEPMSATNAEAYTQIKKTDWTKYTYSAMLILGASPAGKEVISDAGKGRCRAGAELFRKGLAPFIIVSGGHVRPVGTAYAEGVEMKKYLVNELKIPADAVMVDPYARHTTTNVRNAIRIAWRSGIPVNKRMLCVSDAMHLVYVNSPVFKQRCTTELGYMPAADIQQSDLYFLSFLPDLRSLQANPLDPLDP